MIANCIQECAPSRLQELIDFGSIPGLFSVFQLPDTQMQLVALTGQNSSNKTDTAQRTWNPSHAHSCDALIMHVRVLEFLLVRFALSVFRS